MKNRFRMTCRGVVHRKLPATGLTRFEPATPEHDPARLDDLEDVLRRAMEDYERLSDLPGQDEIAVPGSRLVLQFTGQQGPRYAIIAAETPGSPAAEQDPAGTPSDPLIVPPTSSLGRSLLGAHAGELLRYTAEDGESAVYVLTVHNSHPA